MTAAMTLDEVDTAVAQAEQFFGTTEAADAELVKIIALLAFANAELKSDHLVKLVGGDTMIDLADPSSVDRALENLTAWIEDLRKALTKLVTVSSAKGFSIAVGGDITGLIPTVTVSW